MFMKFRKIYFLGVVLLFLTIAVFATRKFSDGEFCVYVDGQLSPVSLGLGSPTSALTTGFIMTGQCKVSDVNRTQYLLYFWASPQSENSIVGVTSSGW